MQELLIPFGPFVLDPGHGLLSIEGRPVALSSRGTVILRALIEAGGEAVTKSTLMERAWPGTLVEEGNIAVQVATLRKSLAALSPHGRDWIETVPRVGYRLLQPAEPARMPPKVSKATIAVLPFDSLGAEPGQQWFADGIVEELTMALSRFRTFAVVARASTLAFRDAKTDIRHVGERLGVSYLLDGSVRRAGDRIRIATHLVDAATGHQLWADRFDGDLASIFDVEDRITETVVGLVEPQIRKAEIERARRRRPDDLGAYDLYLQALPYVYASAPPNWDTALEILGRSIVLDPSFAPALAAAAWVHEKRIRQYMPPLGADDTAEALSLARRAIAADPDDATVLAIGGWVPIVINSEFETGLGLVRRALAMNPNNLTVLTLAGFANVFAGDLDEAELSFFRAFQLSPRSPETYLSLTGLGQVHLLTGEFEEAIRWTEQSLAINDSYPATIGNLAASYALAGRLDEARAMMAKLMQVRPVMTLAKMSARRIRDRLRWRNVLDGLRLAGMPEDGDGPF
jgi:TolB-like protein/Tfp pilus assembly protein PilF